MFCTKLLHKIRFAVFSVLLLLAACQPLHHPENLTVAPETQIMRNQFVPEGDLIGASYQINVKPNENIIQIGEQYSLGYRELHNANPLKALYHLRAGSKLILPKEYILPPQPYRRGIVINIAELRLYYFQGGTVSTYPVALGKEGWHTPLGKTYVYRKQEQPTWHVPKSIIAAYYAETGEQHPEIVPPGPANPLGHYAIYLGWHGYLIHGTNNPASIGNLVSSGCIRMYNGDVAKLYSLARRGTPVHIIYYPVKAGWYNNKLYLEAHPQIRSEENFYQNQAISPQQIIATAVNHTAAHIDWEKVAAVLKYRTGIPTVIGYR